MNKKSHKFEVPFAMIPNKLLHSKEISMQAKTIWAYLQSKPENWDFSTERISWEMKECRETVMKYLKELIEHGWVVSERQSTGRIDYRLVMPKWTKATVETFHRGNFPPVSNKDTKIRKSNMFSNENSSLVGKKKVDDSTKKKKKEPSTTPLLVTHFCELVTKEVGVTPATARAKSNAIVKQAKQHLTDTQIKDLFDWFMGQPIPDHDKLQISRALSTYNINKYKVENGIK